MEVAVAETDAEPPKKKSKLPLLAGIVLALALGGGGFYAVYSGMILGGGDSHAAADGHAAPAADHGDGHGDGQGGDAVGSVIALPDVAFVELQPLMVGLAMSDPPRQLRLEAHLEVSPAYASDVQKMMPRIMDVMNSYLRAVEVHDLSEPAALLRIRAQLLRRIQVVTGEGRVRDLLVTSFLIS
ncbi:MAG: flagellar basal body-associated FliL family protein [Rhodobacteraceae bacterium]|nr:flagellar basal body-associated FliL family protein [Paracoccaceae bacterium]